MKRINCAIYTRKSTDEGLEQEFNSLDAQRDACEAYIKSQKHEGWVCLPEMFDDGGLSGGTMDRPALRRLLAYIGSGKVHTVVVYKVDRLTRSLSDFAKIVDVLDAAGASFVSVTQQFNTTTSMGRLTLNMLLSFAQFEREIAGERIRDKIAASKAKGMWMGGTVPLGYDVQNRKLVINESEAETVRLIFERYIALGSVSTLQAELARRGFRSKQRDGVNGRISGGKEFSRGILYRILQNHVYRGEISHKGNVYPGQHDAIIETETWSTVQSKLSTNRQARMLAVGAEAPSLLSGLIFDSDGNRMTPTHANKRGRRYRYYISQPLLGRGEQGPGSIRLPAGEVDSLVFDRLRSLIGSAEDIANTFAELHPPAAELDRLLRRAEKLDRQWTAAEPVELRKLARQVIEHVTLAGTYITMCIGLTPLAEALGGSKTIDAGDRTVCLTIDATLQQAGKGKRLIIGDFSQPEVNDDLVRLIREAFETRELLLAPTDESINAITTRMGRSNGRLSALIRLSYLAPDIVSDIFAGRQPLTLSVKRLIRTSPDLPLDWAEQRQFLGFH